MWALGAGCVSSCSVAAELREITSMGVCSVGREHCSTAALQHCSWTAGTLQLETHCWPCNLVFLEHTRGTHDCGVVGSNAVTSGYLLPISYCGVPAVRVQPAALQYLGRAADC